MRGGVTSNADTSLVDLVKGRVGVVGAALLASFASLLASWYLVQLDHGVSLLSCNRLV